MNYDEVQFFDNLAPQWDGDEILSTPEKIRSILSKLPLKIGDNVLDLGTGTGVLIPYIKELIGDTGTITAVDGSIGMLTLAIKKYGDLDNVNFIFADFESTIFDSKFDLIMLYSVYPHLHYPEATLKELLNNLNPGGCIIVAFPTDETFINNIHRDRKADSDLLPSAAQLAARFRLWGLRADVHAATPEEYIVKIAR